MTPKVAGWRELSRARWTTLPWGINGCTSVLASILSAMLAISFGFSRVLVAASVAYLVALGVIYPLAVGETLQRIRKTAN